LQQKLAFCEHDYRNRLKSEINNIIDWRRMEI